jgi:hypothetical protein
MANNFLENNNKIGSILAIGHLLKSIRLILLIFNFSYFIGMLWLLSAEQYILIIVNYNAYATNYNENEKIIGEPMLHIDTSEIE